MTNKMPSREYRDKRMAEMNADFQAVWYDLFFGPIIERTLEILKEAEDRSCVNCGVIADDGLTVCPHCGKLIDEY